MINLTVLVLLGLASYRITRLIVLDGIFDELREWFFKKLDFKKDKTTGMYYDRTNIFMTKLSYLLQCTWCTGVWVSLVVYYIYSRTFDFIPVAAIAGLQGLLHALEPADE